MPFTAWFQAQIGKKETIKCIIGHQAFFVAKNIESFAVRRHISEKTSIFEQKRQMMCFFKIYKIKKS